ncbi:MAG: cyanophycin synthetase, partial [Candidatus Paceibacterota bacterium]
DSEKYFDKNLELKIPGEHNRKDASVALAIADFIGIPKEVALKSIKEFSGTWRRFEYKGETAKGAKVYDDYGHHPAEIKATIAGTKEAFPDSKIIVVFQPHLFSRTKLLLADFQKAFEGADKTILLPIYPAREEFDPTISSENIITENSKNIEMAKDFSDASKKAFEYGNKDDVILVMGAGDVYEVTNLLLNQ